MLLYMYVGREASRYGKRGQSFCVPIPFMLLHMYVGREDNITMVEKFEFLSWNKTPNIFFNCSCYIKETEFHIRNTISSSKLQFS